MHRRWHILFVSALLSLALIHIPASNVLAVGTPAGTIIECYSTANYTDSGGEYLGQATSNVVTLTVAKHSAASLSPPSKTINTHPGHTLHFPVELRNLGNAEDAFLMYVNAPAGWDSVLYLDDNGDGELQSSETTEITQTPVLPADSTLKLILSVSVPGDASEGINKMIEISTTLVENPATLAVANYVVNPTAEQPEIHLAVSPNPPTLGDSVVLTATLDPARHAQLSLTALAPDGTQTSHVINTNSLGEGSVDLSPDVSGTWVFTAVWPGTAQTGPSTATLAVQCSGPTYTVAGLDMIAVPLQMVDKSPVSLLGSADAALARWFPAADRYGIFDPLAGITSDSLMQNINPGDGYWIATLEETTLAPAGRLVDQSQPYRIPLGIGWQQIGTPYLQAIPWDQVRVIYQGASLNVIEARLAGVMLDYCWGFVKTEDAWGYALVHWGIPGAKTTLEPWKGYWVYLAKEAQLELQPPALFSQASTAQVSAADQLFETERQRRDRRRRGPVSPGDPGSSVPVPVPQNPGEWYVILEASAGEVVDYGNFMGVSSNSAYYGIVNPPRPNQYVDLYFPTSYGSQGVGPFASDVRPTQGAVDVWEFEVISTQADKAHLLEWTGIEWVTAGLSFILQDLQTNTQIDMQSVTDYEFNVPGANVPARFRITVTR